MKKAKKRPSIAKYETITASDTLGLGVTVTVLRAGHKSLRHGNRSLNAKHSELQRAESLLLIKHRKEDCNKELLQDARASQNEKQARSAALTGKLQKVFQADTSTSAERDHAILYELSPEYRAEYDEIQDKYEPIITIADQLDTARRVRKWSGDAFSKSETWTGKESLATVRSVLFDGLDDDMGLVPAFLDSEGNELEEDGDLEKVACRLSDDKSEKMVELDTEGSAVITWLLENPEADEDGEIPYNHKQPVLTAYKALNFDLTGKLFGRFKQQCLEGVPQANVADVTDVALEVYNGFNDRQERREAIIKSHDEAVKKAGLQSTGSFMRINDRGMVMREPFAGHGYVLAFGLWIADLSMQAQMEFEKKSRRGMTRR